MENTVCSPCVICLLICRAESRRRRAHPDLTGVISILGQPRSQPTQLNPLVLVNSHIYHTLLTFQSIGEHTLLPQIHEGKKTNTFCSLICKKMRNTLCAVTDWEVGFVPKQRKWAEMILQAEHPISRKSHRAKHCSLRTDAALSPHLHIYKVLEKIITWKQT